MDELFGQLTELRRQVTFLYDEHKDKAVPVLFVSTLFLSAIFGWD